ncbi:hypothetical protein BPAE_0591g00030 [Botrytis paeoniae]|uniref:Peptidase C14 caspase domain-containing protein n=1 Tax=Botrytis paeoniae TaxID=278948 RepID=A0A4Z1EXE5_9HELO|nr:hypothetical protein BPAE_0591g00030 [Botrytis paeoniae]
MEEGKINPKNHAILIGINSYKIKPLNGCVRDVQEIKKYLDLLPDPVNTKMLIADESNPSRSFEDQKLWPTYDNVISSIKNISSSGQPGDFVYIHFSGHGTSINPSNKPSSASTGDSALVLLNEASDPPVRYLRGSELTQLLSDMVDKKLMVTLVLDCCQSGGVMRNDSSIRFLEYDPLIDAAYPSSYVQYLNPTYRHIVTSYDTLRNPNGYTIIAASGPHEEAQEYDFSKNGQHHGALSYFLLKAWKESGGPAVKQQLIYQYLSAKVRKTFPGQNPMCYGANNQGFFGGVLTEINQTSILVVRNPDKSTQLQAGHVHGICDGDQFSLYPFGDFNRESGEPIIAKVIHVRTLVSDLKLLNIASAQVRTGWFATPLTHLSLRKFPIRIQLSAPFSDDWETARKERQSLNIINMNQTLEQPTSFIVIQNNETENGYEIRDESSMIIQQPSTRYHKRGDPDHILDIIEHIARFKLVKNMVNEALADLTHPFNESFNIKLTNSIGKEFYPGCSQTGWFQPGCSHLECSVEVKDGDKLYLHVDNRRDHDLYIYIYSLGPFWNVENALGANHVVIQSSPRNNVARDWKKGLRIQAPDDIKHQERYQYEEIVKVFFTSQLTSFASLELPELGKPMRGGRPLTDRATGRDGPPENWAAVNFRFHVSSK